MPSCHCETWTDFLHRPGTNAGSGRGARTHTAFWKFSVEIEGQAEGRFICSLGAGRPVGIPVAPSSLLAAAECDHILHIPVAFYFLITCFKPLVAGNPKPFPYLIKSIIFAADRQNVR